MANTQVMDLKTVKPKDGLDVMVLITIQRVLLALQCFEHSVQKPP